MEEFIGEHGGVLVSGVVAILVVISMIVLVSSAGEIGDIAILSVIGG